MSFQSREFIRYITVRTQFIGFHKYENAPEKVAFLKNRHRHRFEVEATLQVFHEDRELEFFTVQDILDREIIPYMVLQDNPGSCEQMAEFIAEGLINTYGENRKIQVVVSEDGENDGSVVWIPYLQLSR